VRRQAPGFLETVAEEDEHVPRVGNYPPDERVEDVQRQHRHPTFGQQIRGACEPQVLELVSEQTLRLSCHDRRRSGHRSPGWVAEYMVRC
jgi:hypothetical protein